MCDEMADNYKGGQDEFQEAVSPADQEVSKVINEADLEEGRQPHGEPQQSKSPEVNAPKKRGMKPRSKRNRKRPKSKLNEVEMSQPYHTSIVPLELEGETISTPTGCRWLREVQPYPYTFSTFAKARWIGRTVLDVYHREVITVSLPSERYW